MSIEMVKRFDQANGFVVLPMRWGVVRGDGLAQNGHRRCRRSQCWRDKAALIVDDARAACYTRKDAPVSYLTAFRVPNHQG